jgi:hypothetical protein
VERKTIPREIVETRLSVLSVGDWDIVHASAIPPKP